MPLNIAAYPNYVLAGEKIRAEASGGEAPYTYSLIAGGDGGSITSIGIYTAPDKIVNGFQVILVTDNLGNTATVEVFLFGLLQMICKIIQGFMVLSDDQIYIYNQKIDIPKDEKIYIAVKINSAKVIGNNVKYDSLTDSETFHVTSSAQVSIDIMSRGSEALLRKEEVLSALVSQFSVNAQAANGFHIARVPSSFVDLSQLEASAIPYRFNISFNVHYSKKITKEVEFYDTFDAPTILAD